MTETLFTVLAFLVAGAVVFGVSMLLGNRSRRTDERIRELSGDKNPSVPGASSGSAVAQFTRSTLPKIGMPLLPGTEEARSRLKARMLHAGFYSPHAMVVFLGAKMLLMVLPLSIGIGAGLIDMIPLTHGVAYGLLGSGIGMLAPNFWLDWRKSRRQVMLRRALPDALDVMAICVKGGLTLPAAFARVVEELETAHPLLALEFNIVQRGIHLGLSTGDALRQFADRCDLEEAQSFASVIAQSERYGASLVNALKVHADALRLKRQQRAEETAQKASVKLLFPTLLFIFPAIFVVVLGPAVVQIGDLFAKMNKDSPKPIEIQRK